MATQFAPVEWGTIKQGDFAKECEKAFRKLQKGLIGHVEKFGLAAAAVLTTKVTIRYDVDKEAFAIITDIDEKQPKIPSNHTVTSAFLSEDPDSGEPCLFSQKAGTSTGNPRQALICDEQGHMVNQDTGEIANNQ
jgi:hypothetical protein